MTNGEKYKTAKERSDSFEEFCKLNKAKNEGCCDACCLCDSEGFFCQFLWLELEAKEEKPMPCPFCGAAIYISHFFGKTQIECKRNSCGYKYRNDELPKESDVIAAHNRICKAVDAYNESEVK